jgi:FkbM family methyltransferase
MSTVPLDVQYYVLAGELIREVVRPGTIGVDVGAFGGGDLARMVDSCPHGRHIGVEPLPHFAAALRHRFPTCSIHEAALDAAGGVISEFHHVVTNPGYSGLRRRRYDRPDEVVELIFVRTATLDGVVPEEACVSLVMIDAEGGELGVLYGGRRTLARCRPFVVVRHGLGGSDHYGTRPEAVHDLLASFGLRVSLLQRHAVGLPPLTRSQFVHQFETCENYCFVAVPE